MTYFIYCFLSPGYTELWCRSVIPHTFPPYNLCLSRSIHHSPYFLSWNPGPDSASQKILLEIVLLRRLFFSQISQKTFSKTLNFAELFLSLYKSLKMSKVECGLLCKSGNLCSFSCGQQRVVCALNTPPLLKI